MNLRSWFYSLRQALSSMTQGGLMSLASMATVAVSLLVLSVIMLMAVNLEYMATTVEAQVEIRAYLCTGSDADKPCPSGQDLTTAEKQQLLTGVRSVPGVNEAVYVSKEEALERLREQFKEQKDILEGLEESNPLRDALEIKAAEPTQVESVATSVRGMAGVADVDYGRETVERLLKVTHAIRVGGLALVLLLLIATVLTISNTIRLAVYAKRREISIMKLVGATDWFIRRPFMLEGIFLGGIGALVSMLATGAGYRWVARFLHENVPFLPIVSPDQVINNLTIGLLLLGGVLGAVGSAVSLRRFLKV